jgi:hypothetical protein
LPLAHCRIHKLEGQNQAMLQPLGREVDCVEGALPMLTAEQTTSRNRQLKLPEEEMEAPRLKGLEKWPNL